MKFKLSALYVALLVVCSSCAGTRELPPMPDYNSRDAYPELYENSEKIEWNSISSRDEFDTLDEMAEMQSRYYKRANCKAAGDITVSFVVNKEAQIDAPIVEQSLTEDCDRAVLLGLKFMKFDEPAHLNGKPINILTKMIFTIDTRNF